MLSLQNASKSYWSEAGETRILEDVTLDFPVNENIGILGYNGAGKSTFLRIVAGIEHLDVGDIRVHRRVSWPLGFSGGFAAPLSGEENCRFIARIYGLDADDIIDFVTDFSELGRYMRAKVKTYSSGMRARLAFGLSMAIDFEVYLIDEVTAVGDKSFQQKCREAFAERRERSNVLVVSHSLNTIKEYCSCAAVLQNGEIQLFHSIDEAAKSYEGTKRVL